MVKGKYVVFIIIILLLIVSGTRFLSASKQKHDLKIKVEHYLLDQGYKKTDIKRSKIINVGQHTADYALLVTFKDEPNVDYFYANREDEIMQIDVVARQSNTEFKHLE